MSGTDRIRLIVAAWFALMLVLFSGCSSSWEDEPTPVEDALTDNAWIADCVHRVDEAVHTSVAVYQICVAEWVRLGYPEQPDD